LNVTWDRLLEVIAEVIGPQNFRILLGVIDLVGDIAERGLDGLLEWIEQGKQQVQDLLDPATIKEQAFGIILGIVRDTLIRRAIEWVASLLVPGGGIGRAVKAIFDILVWLFRNYSRIRALVDTVAEGFRSLIGGGAQEQVAGAVERTLAGLVVPIIDLFAGLLGLRSIPMQIREGLNRVRDAIWRPLRRLLEVVVGRVRDAITALLQRVGLIETPLTQPDTFTVEDQRAQLWVGRDNKVKVQASPQILVIPFLQMQLDRARQQHRAVRPIQEAIETAEELERQSAALTMRLAQTQTRHGLRATRELNRRVNMLQDQLIQQIRALNIRISTGRDPCDAEGLTDTTATNFANATRFRTQQVLVEDLYTGARTQPFRRPLSVIALLGHTGRSGNRLAINY
ncbi:MAG: hypothetical protein L0219_19505, partial [Phycisphaerales bacterium]|nr:hypothetical protein [Phycisphaerales bacterium]